MNGEQTFDENKQEIEQEIQNAEEIAEQEEIQPLNADKPLSDLDKSIEIIKALEKEKSELKDNLLRLAAEMDNLRKRTALDVEKARSYAITEFARDLLPVADNLQRALQEMEKPFMEEANPAVTSIISGIKLTQKDLESAFNKNNIVKQQSVGKIFNPNFDKVVQEREDNSVPAGTVLEEWQAAYTIKDRVLREAVVVVAKSTSEDTENATKSADIIDDTPDAMS
jgi:molecular chaperone GrpE